MAKDSPLKRSQRPLVIVLTSLAGPACVEQLLALKACLALPSNTPGLLDAAMPSLKQTEYGDVEEAAVAVIAYQRPVTAAQVDLLVRTARDHKDQTTRWAAVKGLAEMGPEAQDGLSELVKMVHAAGPISALTECIMPVPFMKSPASARAA